MKISSLHIYKIRQQQLMDSTIQNFPPSKIRVSDTLNLEIWQNDPNRPLNGISATPDQQVGFASLSFLLVNTTAQPVTLRLEKIEIRPVGSQKALLSLAARDLILQPLEYAPQRYQLSNREGYANVKQVEAVIIYRLDEKEYILRSLPVQT